MMNLTFGEQVKIILSRKGMTIKELAELVEQHTGKPMSRQNMTQRLGRDNFQEQDMRLIAEILGCEFTLSIMEPAVESVSETVVQPVEEVMPRVMAETEEEIPREETRDITMGELADMEPTDAASETAERDVLRKGVSGFFKKSTPVSGKVETEQAPKDDSDQLGEINPYTRKEYESNSVRMHPKRIGYVQVYDQDLHKWTDMTEWAFLGYQERKKKLLGKDYKPPIYLD